VFLQGFLRFLDEKSSFFDGELWCFCGRIVVLKCTNLNGEKCATFSNFIFQQGLSGIGRRYFARIHDPRLCHSVWFLRGS
jgi:hypothetical protein